MIFIIGACDNITRYGNNPMQASTNDMLALSKALDDIEDCDGTIFCFDSQYESFPDTPRILYIRHDFKFTNEILHDDDIVLDFANLAKYKMQCSKKILYLELGCQWSKGLPIDLILFLHQTNVRTVFNFDYATIQHNCNLALSEMYGEVYVMTQMRISGDFKYLKDNEQFKALQLYTDLDDSFETEWTKHADNNLSLRLQIYGIDKCID
jgi:hypothetical protein